MSSDTIEHGSALDELGDITARISAHIDEPLIAACPFARRGQMTQKFAGKFGGAVAYLGARQHAKMKAGGLPEHFYLAVTGEHVRAIGYKLGLPGRKRSARRSRSGAARTSTSRRARAVCGST